MATERSGWWLRPLVLAAMMALVAAPVMAQGAQGAGRIVGRVVDGQTGAGLNSVSIQVAGTGVGTLSGFDGRFVLNNVPAGDVSLVAQAIGYAARMVTGVRVQAGVATEQGITLDASAVELAAIEVTAAAERGSVNRAIDAQRNAAGILSAISAEQISRSPDGDAAAAVQRVSGVTVQDGKFVFVRGLGERYTTTSLNGARVPSPEPERKMVPLDLFPAGLLQQITTSKTFTPNLAGDFSGAQVDIRTREFPGNRQFTVSTGQGFNTAATGRMLPMAPRAGGEWLAAATGPRELPDVVRDTRRPTPGPMTNAMVDAMRNAWSAQERRGLPGRSLGLSLGGTDPILGRDIGYLASLSYSLSDEANLDTFRENVEGDSYSGSTGRQSVLAGGLFNLSTLMGTHSRVALNNSYNRTADNEARLERGFYENHGTNIQVERLRYVERTVRSHQLQLQHQLARNQRLEWSVTASAVSRQEPDRSEWVTWLDPEVPTWYNQEGAFRAYGGLTEDALEASAEYRLDFGTPARALRFGGLFRTVDRDAYDTGFAIRTRDWAPNDPRWQGTPEQIFDGRFTQNGDRLFEMGIFNAGGNYVASDRILAGFAMVEWALTPRISFVGGARVEQSELDISFQDVLGTEGRATPAYTDVLPAAAFNVELTEAQKLRISASRTLARPEYREIAPICYRAGLGEEQRCGNPELRRTLIQNYDVRWERYPGAGEMMAVALFAKRFQDPLEPRYQGRSGTNSLWFQNSASAVNYGIEVEAMRTLAFIRESLDNLSFFANVTVMKSEVDTGAEGDAKRAMTGQAPYVLNTGITWTERARGAASATVLFNVVGERIINARPSGQTVLDMVEQPRPSLDVALRFPVLWGASGKLDLKNLLDSPYEVTQGDLTRATHRSGRGASLGLSWKM
jgi:hypothetical protein